MRRKTMAKIWMIYCADENWGIGNQGELLVRIPEDLKDRFKALTYGHPVIMGRKTLESLPGKKGLPGRLNIVLSRTMQKDAQDLLVMRTPEDVISYVDRLEGDVFVIGGGEVYRLFQPYCAGAYVTKVPERYPADTFVPNLEQCPGWKCIKKTEFFTSVAGVQYRYEDYINTNIS